MLGTSEKCHRRSINRLVHLITELNKDKLNNSTNATIFELFYCIIIMRFSIFSNKCTSVFNILFFAGDDVIMVPFLQEGLHYDLNRVIIKEERSPMQKLARVAPGAISVGKLTDFVKDEVIPGTFNRLSEVQKVETIHNQRYVFEESDMKHGVKKTVRVEILGCDHYTLWSNPECNSLVVDFDNRGNVNTVSV